MLIVADILELLLTINHFSTRISSFGLNGSESPNFIKIKYPPILQFN